MNIKVFKTNNNGKIEFTRCELEKLLNEIYNEGYAAGEKHTKETYWTWTPTPTVTSPTLPITYTTTTTPIHNLRCENGSQSTVSNNNETPKTYTCINDTGIGETKGVEGTHGIADMSNFNALATAVEGILNSAFDPKTFKATAAIQPKTDAFTNLAKELQGL